MREIRGSSTAAQVVNARHCAQRGGHRALDSGRIRRLVRGSKAGSWRKSRADVSGRITLEVAPHCGLVQRTQRPVLCFGITAVDAAATPSPTVTRRDARSVVDLLNNRT
jgi:hypothetical protein